ncbi:Protein of unknown function [Bacillus mycoides]|nr:Protein of unknown function [Bacillus mycoides]
MRVAVAVVVVPEAVVVVKKQGNLPCFLEYRRKRIQSLSFNVINF